jgi:hypothetical protein
MESGLFLLVIIMMIIWGIAYFGYEATGPIHILLGLSAIIVVLRIIARKRYV